jgi:hypothetical protein
MLNFFLGIAYTLLTIILGKILFYFIYISINRIYTYLNRKKISIRVSKEILTSILQDKSFIKDIGKIVHENEKEIAAKKILEHSLLQKTIQYKLEENKYLSRSEVLKIISETISKAISKMEPQ